MGVRGKEAMEGWNETRCFIYVPETHHFTGVFIPRERIGAFVRETWVVRATENGHRIPFIGKPERRLARLSSERRSEHNRQTLKAPMLSALLQ